MAITNNQRETVEVIDDLDNQPFSVKGNSTSGAIYVEATNTLAGSPSKATASAPTYIEGSSNPLSTDLAGNLRVLATIDTSAIATSANQTNGLQKTKIVDGSGNVIASTSNALNVSVQNASIAVTGTFWQATQPISAASLPLPSGAATAAKQPALGTAGTASSDVITIQGIASMTAVKVDGSAVTQPVSLTSTTITGTVAVTQSGTWTVQPGNTANTTPWLTAPSAASTAVGTAIYSNTALSSTKQAVNASAGQLYGYHIYNPNTTVIYIQLFNLASVSVTVGTTAPTAVLAVPAGGWADAPPATPIAFGTALTIAATTTSTGSGTPSTALLCNIWYK